MIVAYLVDLFCVPELAATWRLVADRITDLTLPDRRRL